MTVFPTGIVGLALRLALAVLVFLAVTYWPVPQFLAHLTIVVPQLILWIVGFIAAVLAFWRLPFWTLGRL